MKKEILSMRQQWRWHLKKQGCDFNYNAKLSRCYNGEGFYVNNRNKVVEPIKTWGWDKHWAYGGVLKNNILPKSNKMGKKETPLGIFMISYKRIIKSRYTEDFHLTLYRRNKNDIGKDIIHLKDGREYRWLTNLDFEIFTDLYEIDDLRIEVKKYFQDYGKLNWDEVIDQAYIDKQNKKYDKVFFESVFYGLNCKKMYDYKNPVEYNKYKDSIDETGYEYCRSKYVAIALFQTAYLRYEEWQLFKKYKDHIIYMNTDSIYTDIDIQLEDSPLLGHYHKEYNGQYIYFIRRNAYAILDDNKKLKESKIGGVLNKFITQQDLKKLYNRKEIKVKTRDEEGNITDITLQPTFRMYYFQDKGCNLKYFL